MTMVAGVDFGTLSVRVTLVDSQQGPIGTSSASYPLNRRREDSNFATQSHADQMTALATATREVLRSTGIDGSTVVAIALDTTGSSGSNPSPTGITLDPVVSRAMATTPSPGTPVFSSTARMAFTSARIWSS